MAVGCAKPAPSSHGGCVSLRVLTEGCLLVRPGLLAYRRLDPPSVDEQALIGLTSRRQDNHCGSCNAG